jgi:hypothetical protein
MTYYFDTNILVTAARYDFPIEPNQAFWGWLVELGKAGIIRIPEMVYGEIGQGKDSLAVWAKEHRGTFLAPTEETLYSLTAVLNAYENPIRETTLERIKADPYVVAHAHAQSATVVSYETPSNATVAHNKKIPTICESLGVPCIRFPQFLWLMKS